MHLEYTYSIYSECKEACLKASCCWETGCRSANEEVCANYEACGRIGDEGSSFPVKKTEVEYLCSKSKLFSQGLSKEERGENMENCMHMYTLPLVNVEPSDFFYAIS